jgi:glycosyltransferase involved in cell wall biosynthesis
MGNNKQVLLSICNIAPKRLGSFEEFLLSLTKELKTFDHIIVFREKPIPEVETLLEELGVKINIFKPSRYSFVNLFYFLFLIFRTHATIVHFHFYPIYSVVNYLKYISNIKLIYTDHMGIAPSKTHLKKILRRLYYRSFFTLFNYGIDEIICVSNFVKSKYEIEYGIKSNKLKVIYNGINTRRFSKINNNVVENKRIYDIKDEYVVSCLAGLRENKGVQCLIKAAPLILKEIPNVKFIIVGDGDYKSSLENMVDYYNLKNNFIFTGYISSTEKVYSISSCVVIPSLINEAFCFVAAESLSMEIPIVAFDSGALYEIFGKCPIADIVDKDYHFLAASIIDVLQHPPEEESLELSSTFIYEELSLKVCAKKYAKLYTLK